MLFQASNAAIFSLFGRLLGLKSDLQQVKHILDWGQVVDMATHNNNKKNVSLSKLLWTALYGVDILLNQ